MIDLKDYINESMIGEAAEGETYVVYRQGGSISDQKFCNAQVGYSHVKVVKIGLDKATAMEERKAYNKTLSPGEKKYYGIKYAIAPEFKVKWNSEEEKEKVMKKSQK